MSRQCIFVSSSFETFVENGEIVPIGAVRRQYNEFAKLIDNSIVVSGNGSKYKITALITLAPTNRNCVTLRLKQDNADVAFAFSDTLDPAILAIKAIVINDNIESSRLSFVLTGSSAVVYNDNVVVELLN